MQAYHQYGVSSRPALYITKKGALDSQPASIKFTSCLPMVSGSLRVLPKIQSNQILTLNSNMTSFFRFVNKRAINRLGIISLAHVPVHVTDFPIVNVHVDELSSARIWQHKLCATLSTNVNINCHLPIKVYYGICTLRHIRIEIIHGSQKVFWVLTWVGGY